MACASASAQDIMNDTAVVAYINGEPVVKSEFMMQARRERSEVIRYFRITYNCEYGEGFWNKNIDGQSPSDFLKEKTLDTLRTIKVQQILAKEVGIVNDLSYTSFLNSLEVENRRRLEAKNANKVIYGPVQYSEEVYYNYLFSNMVISLKNILGEQVFNLTDDKLRGEYEKEKECFCSKGFLTNILLMEVKDSNELDLWLTPIDLVFNDSLPSPEEEDGLRSIVRETAKKMQAGESRTDIVFQGANYTILVKDKVFLGYYPLELCKSRIKENLIGKMYDNYILDLRNKAKVTVNQKNYLSIRF